MGCRNANQEGDKGDNENDGVVVMKMMMMRWWLRTLSRKCVQSCVPLCELHLN